MREHMMCPKIRESLARSTGPNDARAQHTQTLPRRPQWRSDPDVLARQHRASNDPRIFLDFFQWDAFACGHHHLHPKQL